MIPVQVMRYDEHRAKKLRERRDKQYDNIYPEGSTDERWVGDLGEFVAYRWLFEHFGTAVEWILNEAAGKADFKVNGTNIDAKTVKRKWPPSPTYTAGVTARHVNNPVADEYLFLTYQYPAKRMWIVGGISHDEFKEQATYYGPGDRVHASYTIREGHALYNIEHAKLTEPEAWRASL